MNETTLTPEGYEYYEAMRQPIGCPAVMYVDINLKNKSIVPKPNVKKDRHKLIEFGLKNKFQMYVGTKLMDDSLILGTKKYPTSSSSKQFRKDQVNSNIHFLRVIFDWGSNEEMRQEEYELLDKYRLKNKSLFYNKDNQRAGKKKIDYNKIEKLYEDANKLRNIFYNESTDKWAYAYDDSDFNFLSMSNLEKPKVVGEINKWARVQTRKDRIIKKNMSKIKDRIKDETGRPSKKAKAIVVLKDRWYSKDGIEKPKFYKFLIISGNHLIRGYVEVSDGIYKWVSTLPLVMIPPEIHEKYIDSEINELSNHFNELIEHQEPYSIADAEKDCWDKIHRGHSWGTTQHIKSMKSKGLDNTEVNKVIKKVTQQLNEDKAKAAGKVIPDYRVSGIDRDLLVQAGEQFDDGETFIWYRSAASPKLDELLVGKKPTKKTPIPNGFYERNVYRKSHGKNPYTKIAFVGYARSDEVEKNFYNYIRPAWDKIWEMSKQELPPITYHLVEREIDQIIYDEKREVLKKTA